MAVDENERARRRRLAKAHVDAENAHDLDAIMRTFSPLAYNVLNGGLATTPEQVAAGHILFGLTAEPGIMSDLQVVPEVEHFTDDEIVYEGRFRGVHTGTAPGYPPPTHQLIELPYIVVYRFDDDDLLVSERANVDLSPLYSPAPAAPESSP